MLQNQHFMRKRSHLLIIFCIRMFFFVIWMQCWIIPKWNTKTAKIMEGWICLNITHSLAVELTKAGIGTLLK